MPMTTGRGEAGEAALDQLDFGPPEAIFLQGKMRKWRKKFN